MVRAVAANEGHVFLPGLLEHDMLMKEWLGGLFPAQRRRPAMRRTGSVAAVAGMESLETRTMLSVNAIFTPAAGVLTVFGDAQDNNIEVSRNAAGQIRINGGAVPVLGGNPTVANTALIQVFGLGGNDVITLNEANGALPRANLFGGTGNDVLTGGSGNDLLFGQSGHDALFGKGGMDLMFGGNGNDAMTGGDGDDRAFGESGNDRMTWNPGDDTDLNEGGTGIDTTEVNGGNGAENFTATANGSRVRFDRISPAPFAIDVGTTENLVVNMKGGHDSFSATGNLAALIKTTVDGGAGNDVILGSNGADVLLGGDGDDFIDGQQGNDVAFMGAGNDTFQWDPGDGSDVVEGQAGTDRMLFNGSGANEIFEASANGGRVRFTRNVGNIVMDLNDVEAIDLNALGGADTAVINDLSGTDLTEFNVDLEGVGGAGDGQPDRVVVNGTNGDDVALVAGDANGVSVFGLAAQVNVVGADAGDRLALNMLAGDDVVEASGLTGGLLLLEADGGAGNDVLIGSVLDDLLLGGDGDDVLLGGLGLDLLDGGLGDDIEIQ
ncbi:MAG: calcium-binding protein [Planctomycetaceae bacterium]